MPTVSSLCNKSYTRSLFCLSLPFLRLKIIWNIACYPPFADEENELREKENELLSLFCPQEVHRVLGKKDFQPKKTSCVKQEKTEAVEERSLWERQRVSEKSFMTWLWWPCSTRVLEQVKPESREIWDESLALADLLAVPTPWLHALPLAGAWYLHPPVLRAGKHAGKIPENIPHTISRTAQALGGKTQEWACIYTLELTRPLHLWDSTPSAVNACCGLNVTIRTANLTGSRIP